MSVLLTTAYFPPIQYFIALSASRRQCDFALGKKAAPEPAWIEACENYQKQSYRNRCSFYAASGPQSLSVPVVHENGTFSLPITRIRVDYSRPWLLNHKRAIVSAYRTSAFFEYYQDELFAIMDRQPVTLWELNLSIIRFFIEKTGLPVELRFTEDYFRSGSVCRDGLWTGLPCNEAAGACDLREIIHPKRPDDILQRTQMEKPYFQVFACKHGFTANLSIMDLLFNEGPNSISFLLKP